MRHGRWLPVFAEAGGGLLLFALVLKLGLLAGLIQPDHYDVNVYRRYGASITGGRVPYRDFDVEYPPGSLPFFIVPALFSHGATTYRRVFEAEMSVVLVVLLVALRLLAGRGALVVAALATGVLGSVALLRFDLAAALLTVVSLLCFLRRHPSAGGLALGAAIAVKGYPAVLLPIVAIYAARTRGKRTALTSCSLAAAVVVLAYAPFAAMAPFGVKRSVDAQLIRPLEIESSGGILFAIGHKLTKPSRCCGYSFSGGTSEAVAVISAVLGAAALLVIWRRFFQSSASENELLLASAAVVATAIGFAKVFSPQYVLWLVALVVAVRDGRRTAIALLLGACALTAWVFPNHWDSLLALHWTPLLVELLRDLLIVTSALFLAVSVRSPRDRRAVGTSRGA
jgi:Glycosyltransferase family 87